MSEDKAIVINEQVQLGTLQATSPNDVIARATDMAGVLAKLIDDRKLYSSISGKKYVRVEGWSTLGAMLGVLPREVEVVEHENGDFEATVELIRTSDAMVIGRASAIVSSDERNWATRERFARRSMAITRATGKAYRLGFAWMMTLAGYEGTPAEEMPCDAEWSEPPARCSISLKTAEEVVDSKGQRYGDCTSEELSGKLIGINKQLKLTDLTAEQREVYEMKRDAIHTILSARK
jgi:hypothetical protein